MASRNSESIQTVERKLVITRIFDAPRAIVWKAWTEPEHLMRWWGPHGFVVQVCTMDLRPGGGWRLAMRSPEGRVDRQRGVIREVVAPSRLVYSYAFEDEAGNAGHETLITILLEEQGNKTKLVLTQATFETVAVRDDHVRGWGEALDHLAEYAARAARSQHNATEINR